MNKVCLRSGALLLAFFLTITPSTGLTQDEQKQLLARINALKGQGIIGRDEVQRAEQAVVLRYNIPRINELDKRLNKASRSIAGTIEQ